MPSAIATTPGPVPPVRARTDDHEPQPTPKKLKSETVEKVPRRPALRDVTNELRGKGGALGIGDAKKQPPRTTKQPRVMLSTEDKVLEVGDLPGDASEKPVVVTHAEEAEKEAVVDFAESAAVSPCATEEELAAFEHLVGQDEEEELATILYTRLREHQMRHRVCVNYFDDQVQPHINAKMRSILVDWLIEIHYRLKLTAETLFLAITYLDRYLADSVTTRSELQLVGLASLFIASKYEEVEPVDLTDLCIVTNKTYSCDQIIVMERKLLEVLGFSLSAVTAEAFVGYYTHALASDRVTSLLAAFFTQNTLFHLPLLVCYPPADRAAAAVFLGHCVAANERPSDEWIAQWETTTTCSLDDLLPCLQDLCTIMAHASKRLAALHTKFGTKRFGRVAHKPMDELARFLS